MAAEEVRVTCVWANMTSYQDSQCLSLSEEEVKALHTNNITRCRTRRLEAPRRLAITFFAAGGEELNGPGITNFRGASGGSGGGAGNGCEGMSGAGGTDGSNGTKAQECHYGWGLGQGAYPSNVLFIRNHLTPGAGGHGVFTTYQYYGGGGGGGGILFKMCLKT